MSLRSLLFYFCVLFFIDHSTGARILGVFPIPSVSHQNSYRPLMETLSDRGHHVVVVTTHTINYKNEHPNLTQISLDDIAQPIWSSEWSNIGNIPQEKFGFIKLMKKAGDALKRLLNEVLDSKQIQNLIKDPNQKFDLCFVAGLTPVMYAFKDRFNCSLILITSQTAPSEIFESFGNPTNPVAYPAFMATYQEEMGFLQRFKLCIVDVLMRIFNSYHFRESDALIKKYFGNEYRSISEIHKSADLLFINEHVLLSNIRPVMPNTHYFYGMHMKKNKPLPIELKKVLDDAKNGAIYLSLGSNVKSITLSQQRIDDFLEAFKHLPYTILWKWENETLTGKPDNVYISKWYPQQDVFAHPNVKCFITQGGQQSFEEAIHYRIPMIGIPFYGDQYINTKNMIKYGIGIELNLNTIDKNVILDAVNDIMTDSSYHQNIEKLSDLLNDQPQTSLEKAVWWTEYVLKHKGAQHFKPASVNIPFYQYFLLDIIAFVVVCLIIFMVITLILCRRIFKCFRSPKTKRE